MPRRLLAAVLVAAAAAPARGQDDGLKIESGKFRIEETRPFCRLFYDGTLIGSQYSHQYIHPADAPTVFGPGTPWEALALVGGHAGWDPLHEPLLYYHRSGPVGAMFHHLRTRNGGADAAAPVGVAGLGAGTPAAYARPGQRVTFYSVHPELRDLVERSGRFFTYVPDARKRGAKLDFRYGPLRETLAADADARYGLLLVELIEDGFDPGDRLTLEAVRLYRDRLAPDGVIGLHVSNARFRLEPVVERIARELGLAARVWDDDQAVGGKSPSSWVVLARTERALGVLAAPPVEQTKAFGGRNEPLGRLLEKYPPDHDAFAAMRLEWGGPDPAGRAALDTIAVIRREAQPAAFLFRHAIRARDAGEDLTLERLVERVNGSMFRRLVTDTRVDLRTDADRPGLPVRPPPPAKK